MIRVTTLFDLELAKYVEHLAERDAPTSRELAAAALELSRRMRQRVSSDWSGCSAQSRDHIQPNHLQE